MRKEVVVVKMGIVMLRGGVLMMDLMIERV